MIVGDGWYAGRISITGRSAQYGDRLQASWQLVVRYADGRTEVITSDDTVRSATGPIRYSDLFIGECHDARVDLENQEWRAVRAVDVDTRLVPFVGEPCGGCLSSPWSHYCGPRRGRRWPTSVRSSPAGSDSR